MYFSVFESAAILTGLLTSFYAYSCRNKIYKAWAIGVDRTYIKPHSLGDKKIYTVNTTRGVVNIPSFSIKDEIYVYLTLPGNYPEGLIDTEDPDRACDGFTKLVNMGDHILISHRRPSDVFGSSKGTRVGVLIINPIRDKYYYRDVMEDQLIDYEKIISEYDTKYAETNHEYGLDVPDEEWA